MMLRSARFSARVHACWVVRTRALRPAREAKMAAMITGALHRNAPYNRERVLIVVPPQHHRC